MDKKMVDKKIDRHVLGDPAFYNDQIGNNLEPLKANMDKKVENKDKKS